MPATRRALFQPREVSAVNEAEGNPPGTEPYSAERRESNCMSESAAGRRKPAGVDGAARRQRPQQTARVREMGSDSSVSAGDCQGWPWSLV